MPYMVDFPTPTAAELETTIAQLLSSGALYKKYAYCSDQCHQLLSPHIGALRGTQLPMIEMFCKGAKCQKETWWESDEREIAFAGMFHDAAYKCRNCQVEEARYWFIWIESYQELRYQSIFMKVGQYPPLSIDPSPLLAKALGAEDNALYRKALTNGNYSFGIGALAYLRRVIENKVNMLLDLIADAARIANFESEELTRIDEIKASHHVDAKIEYASKILPPHLRPGGHNPLNKLYAVASGGIHGKSDEDCLEDFQNARFEFEYLFKNLTVSNDEAQEFLKRVSKPIGTK